MKPFNEIIKENSLLNSQNVQKLLVAHGLLGIMRSTYSLLNSDSGTLGKQLNIGNLVSNFLTVASNKISSIQDTAQKSEMEFLLINLAENILWEYIIKNNCQRQIIIQQIEEAIRTTCQQCKFKLGPYEKLLMYIVQCFSIGFDLKRNRIIINTRVVGKCHTIHWLDKGKLFILSDILMKKEYIKSSKDLYAFFQPSNTVCIVQCNPEKKYHIAYLIHRLFTEDYASIRGNKGFFCCVEMVFTDMEGNHFKKDSLKKISSKICKEKERYLPIRKEVDRIITRITRRTNDYRSTIDLPN
jgi:hypothetical protein